MESRSLEGAKPGKPGRAGGLAAGSQGGEPGAQRPAANVADGVDQSAETGVLLDALIHDLRTPLSAMSGWLEVLEAHFGEVDGLVARALLGLRRGVEGQTQTLNGLSDVLTKQRVALPEEGECGLLAQLQGKLAELESRPGSPLGATELGRLEPLKRFVANDSLTCRAGGASLGDACATLLQAIAVAQGEDDAPISLAADVDSIRIRLPGATGDLSSLESLSSGLRPHAPRRPQIRPQALWLARSVFRRCRLRLALDQDSDGAVELVIARDGAQPAASVPAVGA